MYYAGIDIGKNVHCMGAMNAQGDCIAKPWMFKQNNEKFEQLNERLLQIGPMDEITVGMEATGHYWKVLWHYLTARGWKVEVFNPLLSSHYSRTNLRGRRTDADASLVIAKVIRDGGFTPLVLNDEMEQLRILCRQRNYFVHQLSDDKRRLGSLTNQVFTEFASLFSNPYGKTALAILAAYSSAQLLAHADLKHLITLIKKASKGHMKEAKSEEIRLVAQSSTALTQRDQATELSIKVLIQQINFVEQQIHWMDQQISDQYDVTDHPIKSINGLGKIEAAIILSELGDLNRFEGAKAGNKMLAYAGGDPRIRQSGKWKGIVKMSKRGSPALRTALFQTAHTVRLHCPVFQKIYEHHKNDLHKHHDVAMSHVVRKLLIVINVLTKTGQKFDATKVGGFTD